MECYIHYLPSAYQQQYQSTSLPLLALVPLDTFAIVFNLSQKLRKPATSRRRPSKNPAIVDMRRRQGGSAGRGHSWWRRAKSRIRNDDCASRASRLDSTGKLDADALCRWSKYQFQQCTTDGTVHYSAFVDGDRPCSRLKGTSPAATDQVSDAMATDFTSGLRLRIDVDRLSAHKISVRRWFYGSRMCRWRAGEASSAASVAVIRRPSPPHLQSMTLTSDVLTAMQKKLLRATFAVINGQVYCPTCTVIAYRTSFIECAASFLPVIINFCHISIEGVVCL